MNNSNQANDQQDRSLSDLELEQNLAHNSTVQQDSSSVSNEQETNPNETQNIDDLDLDTLERLTAPDNNLELQAIDNPDDAFSLAQATLAGNSYTINRSEYIKTDSSSASFSFNIDEQEQNKDSLPSDDSLSADDIALAISSFDKSAQTISNSKLDVNTASDSMLKENSTNLDNTNFQGVDVTMPQDEEPRLKVYNCDESNNIDTSNTNQEQEQDLQIEGIATTRHLDNEPLSSSSLSLDQAVSDNINTTESLSYDLDNNNNKLNILQDNITLDSAFEVPNSDLSDENLATNSSNDKDDDASTSTDSNIETKSNVSADSITNDSQISLDTNDDPSPSTDKISDNVVIDSSTSTITNDSDTDSASDNNSEPNETLDPSPKAIMKGAHMLDSSTAISGMDERYITPVEQSTSQRTMTQEELDIIAQVSSSFSRSHKNQDKTNDEQEIDTTISTKSAQETNTQEQNSSLVPDNTSDSSLEYDNSIEVPKTGVMKGAHMLDSSTAISGMDERYITPVEQSTSQRTMTQEELAIIAQVSLGGAKSRKTAINEDEVSTGHTIVPRENDIFQQTGSSNIARDINSITDTNKTNIFKDATVMEEGHTAIVGLDKLMVASQAPETSTVITGLSANYIEQIQAVNEIAARKNQVHLEAKAKFREEMAAEQALKEQALLQEQEQEQAQKVDYELDKSNDVSSLYNQSELYQSDSPTTSTTPSELDYQMYDGIATQNYQAPSSNATQEASDLEVAPNDDPNYNQEYYDPSLDSRLQNHNDNQSYYDYSQYDESEVQAMPTNEPVKEDQGPNYVLAARDKFNNEAKNQSGQNDENPYSYGTYANKIAHQNASRLRSEQDSAYKGQENDASYYHQGINKTEQDNKDVASKEQGDAPIYYGTYASRLAQDSSLRNQNKNQQSVRYLSPADFENEQRSFNSDNINYEQNVISSDESHIPEPSGIGDGALSQLNLKNNDSANNLGASSYGAKSDDGPVYLVGVKRNKGEINANRSKIIANHNLDNYEDKPTPEEEEAYLKELADAARESIAAPNSEVIKRARMLASQQTIKSYDNTLDNKNAPSFKEIASVASFEQNNDLTSPDNKTALNNSDNGTISTLDNQDKISESKAQSLELKTNNLEATKGDLSLSEEQIVKGSDSSYNFSNMTIKDNVGFGMMIFLYIRQLFASFFSHTTLPLIAPNLSKNLGQSYPSSMPIPFFFVGLVAGAFGSILHSTIGLNSVGSISYLIYLLLTGLTAYRGIHRICAFVSRKWKRDSVLSSASVIVPMLIFIWLANSLIVTTDGIVEATAAFAIASMLAAATAASLTWNFPQDPMDSIGNMSTKGLLFVIILSIMASFGLLHYTVGLSVFGVSIVTRLIFGYLIAKNQGTANRPYVYALQLITLFAILFDLILLKSQNYEFLSKSSLELVAYLRHYSHFF